MEKFAIACVAAAAAILLGAVLLLLLARRSVAVPGKKSSYFTAYAPSTEVREYKTITGEDVEEIEWLQRYPIHLDFLKSLLEIARERVFLLEKKARERHQFFELLLTHEESPRTIKAATTYLLNAIGLSAPTPKSKARCERKLDIAMRLLDHKHFKLYQEEGVSSDIKEHLLKYVGSESNKSLSFLKEIQLSVNPRSSTDLVETVKNASPKAFKGSEDEKNMVKHRYIISETYSTLPTACAMLLLSDLSIPQLLEIEDSVKELYHLKKVGVSEKEERKTVNSLNLKELHTDRTLSSPSTVSRTKVVKEVNDKVVNRASLISTVFALLLYKIHFNIGRVLMDKYSRTISSTGDKNKEDHNFISSVLDIGVSSKISQSVYGKVGVLNRRSNKWMPNPSLGKDSRCMMDIAIFLSRKDFFLSVKNAVAAYIALPASPARG